MSAIELPAVELADVTLAKVDIAKAELAKVGLAKVELTKVELRDEWAGIPQSRDMSVGALRPLCVFSRSETCLSVNLESHGLLRL